MSLFLTTDATPTGERLAHWRDIVGRALVPMRVTPYAPDGEEAGGEGSVSGRIVADRLGPLRLATIEADAQRLIRTRADIARSPRPFVAAHVQTSGRAELRQDGRTATVETGGLLVLDTGRPYTLDFPEPFACRTVLLPRHALDLPDGDLSHVTGTAVGTATGVGAILMPFLATLVASAPSCPPAIADRLAAGALDLFGTLVAERTRSGDGARDELVRRVRDHIDRHLADPELSPETVAAAHHISVRYLHRLFEKENITVGRLIQRRRLARCARELLRGGAAGPSVAAVAHRWGFVSSAHFSRSFRGVYGHSPREWRALKSAAVGGAVDETAALEPIGH
ncbi:MULTISPECIES: helix-turn-helix domain-containing protein [unclassified Streptomyces]|uniref:AraC-like ligand-binding domain-containing protein n=1 Tax=unclassified Streptomyces TaxID=2593676 RepID=UPI000DB95A0E|nr:MULTISPECIES: helix-turn-helix domain-containing protein [unclassified Streptomyces]MYT74561.1 helix-turn-helix domain-containing protein [Streptomyces sp. SID8367]RAJ91544.1 AraC-like DNA-binding protein [Streptomyces sp. PsTaAH-137]